MLISNYILLLFIAVEANPYTIWLIAFHDVFSETIRHLDKLPSATTAVEPGSIEDALMFFDVDLSLWQETEDLIEYVQKFINKNGIAPPLVESQEEEEEEDTPVTTNNISSSSSSNNNTNTGQEDGTSENENISDLELHEMFLDMFNTGMEMIEEDDS